MMVRLPVLLVVLAVIFAMVACSSAGDGSEATLVGMEPLNKTAEPATVEPVAPIGSVQDVETRDALVSLDDSTTQVVGYQNYRSEMILRFEPRSVAADSNSWRIESGLAVLEYPVTRVLEINYDENALTRDFESMTVGQKENLYFLHVPAVGCISTSKQEFERMSSGIVDPEYFMDGLEGAPLIASGELVNGQPALLFDLEGQLLPQFANQDVSVMGRLYVSDEDQRPLQLLMEINGVADFAATGQEQDGTLYVDINWYETVDLTDEIIPPECFQPGLYPVPEGSYEVSSIADLVGFRSLYSIAELVAFYEAAMAADGWAAVEESTVLEDSAFMTFSRNGLETIISIESGPEAGEVSVVISP